jgi:hypothetical protein
MSRPLPVHEMAQALLDASVHFRDGRPAGDDVSLLVLRYDGTSRNA